MEYKRTNPHPSLFISPSQTQTYINSIAAGLLVHLQRQYSPTGLPVRSHALSGIHPQSHWSPCAFTGMHLQSHWASCTFTGTYPHTWPC